MTPCGFNQVCADGGLSASATITMTMRVVSAQQISLRGNGDGTIQVASLLTGPGASHSDGRLAVISDPGSVGAFVIAQDGKLSMDPVGRAIAFWVPERERVAVAGR